MYPHYLLYAKSNNEVIQRADSSNPRRAEREANLSPDGKWKSFPRVPNLLQYVPSGKFFGRVKINGKLVPQTLKTDVFTTAKLRLGDYVKDQRKKVLRPMREVAEILGVSYITVHRLLKRGKLRASDAIRSKVIPLTEIERFLYESTTDKAA